MYHYYDKNDGNFIYFPRLTSKITQLPQIEVSFFFISYIFPLADTLDRLPTLYTYTLYTYILNSIRVQAKRVRGIESDVFAHISILNNARFPLNLISSSRIVQGVAQSIAIYTSILYLQNINKTSLRCSGSSNSINSKHQDI